MKLETILTKRQLEMFMLLAQGYSQSEIAKRLNVSVTNVSKVLRYVYDKLEAKNGAEAIRKALSLGLLNMEDLQREQSMSRKHKSRLETLRDCSPEMLSVIRATRDILHNALNDDYFDREVFERLQERVIAVLDLAVGDSGYVPHIKTKGGEA